MKTGTKSVLFGAHCFLLHPWFVASAWCRLYGFPWDLRLWVAFFVHDLGYWGKTEMDSPDGEEHVLLGGRIMQRLFGPRWEWFTVCHSRYWARRQGKPISRLCVADKYSIALTPACLYLPMARWSGEVYEYMSLSGRMASEKGAKYSFAGLYMASQEEWFRGVQDHMLKWVALNYTGRGGVLEPIEPREVGSE